jgi:hypothetical protein
VPRPWEHVPGILTYYWILLCQTMSDTFFYAWGQVMSGAALAVVAVLLSPHYGWNPKSEVGRTIGIPLLPYAVILLIGFVVNAIRAPVKVHNALLKEKKAIQSALETARMEPIQPQVSALERSMRTKLGEDLLEFSDDEKAVLRYLLHHGKFEQRRLAESCGLPVECRFMNPSGSCIRPDEVAKT